MKYKSDPSRFLTEATIQKVEHFARHHSGENVQRTYAIGDIHGMANLLVSLLDFITTSQPKIVLPSRFVFLGDYVDRGQGSAQVIAIVRLLQELMPEEAVVALKGNHEDMVLNVMSGHGGRIDHRTLDSFPLRHIPYDVVDWLADLPTSAEDELHYYVHAGLNPEYDIDDQSDWDKIWIRQEFLFCNKDFGKHILHGHTPYEEVQKEPFRTGIDTGAVFDGFLTAAEIKSDVSHPVSFFMVNGKGAYWDEYTSK